MKCAAGLSLCFFAVSTYAFVGNAPLRSWSFTKGPSHSLEVRSLVPSSANRYPGSRQRSYNHGRVTVKCMGDIVWSKVTIVESGKAATDQHALTIRAGDIAKGYQVPGQFVQIKVPGGEGKPGFFAIASPPPKADEGGEGLLEFLVKVTASTMPLISAKSGDEVEMSPVMGKGFPIKENFSGYKYDFPVQNVVLMATGTGIAPFRAAIESGALELPDDEDNGVFGRSCRLYWGCKDEESIPWPDRLKEWEAKNVEVVPVLSEPSSSWTGRTGLIQQAIKDDGIRVPRNSGVLVCGHKEMVEDAKAIASAAGVLEGRVLTNF